jgi:hypothetical protein
MDKGVAERSGILEEETIGFVCEVENGMKKAREERFLKVRRREFYYLGCKGPDASADAK